MRLYTFNSRRTLAYIGIVATFIIAGLVGLELAVRKMPSAYCKDQVNLYYGCSHVKSLKTYLSDESTRIFLGDSHLEFMTDYQGFRDYSMPAMLPSEMFAIARYLTSKRKIERVLIGLGAHHMQDKKTTRSYDIFAPETLARQYLPFPIYALETSLTIGFKEYLWDLIFRRSLPKVEGRQTVTDEELADIPRQKREAHDRAAENASRDGMLWWQRSPFAIEEHEWQLSTPKERRARANQRIRFFHPLENYKESEEHTALLALLDVLRERGVDACFVRFPHSREYNSIIDLPRNALYREVQSHLQALVEEHGFRFLDTRDLDLKLTAMHFRDSDHLLVPVVDRLTPVITDACFPDLDQ